MNEDILNAWLKFIIGICFCMILFMMASLSMYSVVFVTQPFTMAPADKNFFLLLSDMSKYILGALATLIAIKGKDQFVPPGLSTAKEREEAMKPTPPTPPTPPTTPPSAPMGKRVEPTIEPVASAAPVVLGFNGKPAPPPAPQPEIE